MTQGGEAVSRLVHAQEIAGSIPAPATKLDGCLYKRRCCIYWTAPNVASAGTCQGGK